MTDEAKAKIREALEKGRDIANRPEPFDIALALLAAEDKPIVSRDMVWELYNADTTHEVIVVCEQFGFSVERPED